MSKTDARTELPKLVRAARSQLKNAGTTFWDRLVAFRRDHPPKELLRRKDLKGLRQREPMA